ncbi:helix-turn-helix domain-containing protein, partial [Paraburkholderia caribensis]|uniref:helix-turn-helix domain-containing protein n=1 Tax=Paraburkholderia caribensis TaxID=75105 RepID=UPI0015901516
MNTLRNMEVFVRVAATGSFTAAAHDLDTTVAHASRAVANLEEHFGTLRISDERDRPFRDGDRRFRQRDRSFRKRDRADRKAGLALRV